MTTSSRSSARALAALLVAATWIPAEALAQPAPPPPPDLPPAAPPPAAAPPAPVAQPVPPPATRAPAPFPARPLPVQPLPPPPSDGWGPSPLPPPDAPGELLVLRMQGVSAKGLPISQRGGVYVEAAGLLTATGNGNGGGFGGLGSGNGQPIAAIDLVARVPVADRTFIDADVPIGFGAIGNPMVGAHHVFRPADPFWVTLGGAFGFPLINNDNFESFTAANAWWDAERFMAYKVPFALRLGLEGHAGIAELRAQIDPVWGVSIASCDTALNSAGCGDARDRHFFALQHALEIQLGHEIGGGLRYQGVVVATNNPSLVGNDNSAFGGSSNIDRYQGTLEPFFRVFKAPILLRVGLVLPLDKPLGAPFDHTWGVRAVTGFTLD